MRKKIFLIISFVLLLSCGPEKMYHFDYNMIPSRNYALLAEFYKEKVIKNTDFIYGKPAEEIFRKLAAYGTIEIEAFGIKNEIEPGKYIIYLDESRLQLETCSDIEIVAEELSHIQQGIRENWILANKYFKEAVKQGYEKNKYEIEAKAEAEKVYLRCMLLAYPEYKELKLLITEYQEGKYFENALLSEEEAKILSKMKLNTIRREENTLRIIELIERGE